VYHEGVCVCVFVCDEETYSSLLVRDAVDGVV